MKRIKIGRSSSCDVVINNNTVSSTHAELIQYDDSRVSIKDLNSSNGTYVNGVRITTETPLRSGDIVTLANEQIDWNSLLNKTVVRGGKNNHFVPTGVVKKVLLGRGHEADKKYFQSEVSSKHATLYKKNDGIIEIVDNNSTNGTYVNGNRISHAILQDGDTVSLARVIDVDWQNIIGKVTPPTPPIPKPKNQLLKYVAIFIGISILLGGGYFVFTKLIPTTSKELPAEEIYAKYKKSIALIYNQYTFKVTIGKYNLSDIIPALPDNYIINEKGELDKGVNGATGTGFFISKDGKIVTNKHVVTLMGNEEKIANFIKSSLSRIILNNYGNQALSVVNAMEVQYISSLSIAMNDAYLNNEKDLIPCTLLKSSNDNSLDVAVIQINTKQTPSSVTNIIDINDIATEKDIAIGKKLYTIGFPNGISWGNTEQGLQATNESGTVNQNISEFLYGHNINVTHGASGSPVFDTKGKFAGIIVSGYEYYTVGPNGNITSIPTQHNQAIKPNSAVNFIKTIN